jgi:hypothetical protein
MWRNERAFEMPVIEDRKSWFLQVRWKIYNSFPRKTKRKRKGTFLRVGENHFYKVLRLHPLF